MCEDRTQNYDPKIYEEYLIHDTSFLLPHHLWPCNDSDSHVQTNITIHTTN